MQSIPTMIGTWWGNNNLASSLARTPSFGNAESQGGMQIKNQLWYSNLGCWALNMFAFHQIFFLGSAMIVEEVSGRCHDGLRTKKAYAWRRGAMLHEYYAHLHIPMKQTKQRIPLFEVCCTSQSDEENV